MEHAERAKEIEKVAEENIILYRELEETQQQVEGWKRKCEEAKTKSVLAKGSELVVFDG